MEGTHVKIDIKPFDLPEWTVARTVLIVTRDVAGRSNAMTAGWLLLGGMWGKAVLTIGVRPDRYTYELLQAVPEFTLNVPGRELHRAVEVCGIESGRTVDKIVKCGMRLEPGRTVSVPALADSLITYECKVVLTAESDPITRHRLYFGEILASYAREYLVRERATRLGARR